MSVDDVRCDQFESDARPSARVRRPSHPSRPVSAGMLAGLVLAVSSLTACATVIPGTAAATTVAENTVPTAASPTTGPDELPAQSPATDTVATTTWMNGVCGSLMRLTHSIDRKPTIDSSSPTTITRSLVRFLGNLEKAVDTTTSELDAARPAPLADGDDVLTTLTDSLTDVRSSLEQAKTNLEKATPRSEAAMERALKPLTAIDDELAPLEQLEGGPEIDDAANAAPNCQELARLAGAGDGFALLGI